MGKEENVKNPDNDKSWTIEGAISQERIVCTTFLEEKKKKRKKKMMSSHLPALHIAGKRTCSA